MSGQAFPDLRAYLDQLRRDVDAAGEMEAWVVEAGCVTKVRESPMLET